jgi:hypothetical protein
MNQLRNGHRVHSIQKVSTHEAVPATTVHLHAGATGGDDPEAFEEYADLFLVIISGLGLLKLIYGDEIAPAAFERAFRAILRGMEKPEVDT